MTPLSEQLDSGASMAPRCGHGTEIVIGHNHVRSTIVGPSYIGAGTFEGADTGAGTGSGTGQRGTECGILWARIHSEIRRLTGAEGTLSLAAIPA